MRIILAALLAFMTTSSFAADFSKKLVTAEGGALFCFGKPSDDGKCPEESIGTLGQIVRAALNNYVDEQNLSVDALLTAKLRRGDLSQALVGATEVTLKPEQIILVKQCVAKVFPGSNVVWSVVQELEPPKPDAGK